MKNSKFNTLFEAAMTRYQRGGFLVGDTIKLSDGFKSSEAFKRLGTNVQEMIEQMVASGLNIRITDIKNKYPVDSFSNPEHSTGEVYLDIALDSGGGRYTHLVTIPSDLASAPEDFYPNLTPIPDKWRHQDKVNIKPEPFKPDDEHISRQTDKGKGTLSTAELYMPTQNTPIPASPATKSPAVNSPGMAEYLKGLAGA